MIREALEEAGRVALGRVVMHTRERLMALEPRDKGILAYTLRMRDEVIDPAKAFDSIPTAKPDKRMIEIARKIIDQQEGPFDPDKFKDRYETALRELIRRKQKGEKLVTAEPVEESNVIDLMEALKKSLKNKGKPAPARAASPARSARRADQALHLAHRRCDRLRRFREVLPRIGLLQQLRRGRDRERLRIEPGREFVPAQRHRDGGTFARARAPGRHAGRGFVVAQIVDEDFSAARLLGDGRRVAVRSIGLQLERDRLGERLRLRPSPRP